MKKYALINGILLDGTQDMQPQLDRVILVADGKIAAITEQWSDLTGYEVVDLRGQYLIPGLINLHVHIPATGKPKKKASDPKKLVALMSANAVMRRLADWLCQQYVLPELYSGVTTIRAVGGLLDCDSRLREKIATGRCLGPRIVAGNMAISVPGGHMAGSLAYEAGSAQEAAEYVDAIADSGADLIKLMITGGVLDARKKGEPGELKMPPEYVKAACDRAHARGLKVAAHVESPEGVAVALENGVDTIEHGAQPDEHILYLFRKRCAALVTTISPALPFALFDRSVSHATEEQQFNGNIVFQGIIACAKACLEAGIPVGLGTDTGCPYITHYDMWREVYYFQKYCGVSAKFALHTATLGNAQILGMADEIGSIAVGKSADLIACRENPLENIAALRTPGFVMAAGRIANHRKLKKYPAVEKELDRFLK